MNLDILGIITLLTLATSARVEAKSDLLAYEADVHIQNVDFQPRTLDTGSDNRITTITIPFQANDGIPIQYGLVQFAIFSAIRQEVFTSTNLISGSLTNGVFQTTSAIGPNDFIGTWHLYGITFVNISNLSKGFLLAPNQYTYPFPDNTPTNLTVTATNQSPIVGMSMQGAWFPDANWKQGNPLIEPDECYRQYKVYRGETRPICVVAANYVEHCGQNLCVSAYTDYTQDPSPCTNLSLRLMRVCTKNYTPGWGDTQRDDLITPPDGVDGKAQYTISMLNDIDNPPTWSALTTVAITPPTGGFDKSFKITCVNTLVPQDFSQIPIICSVGMWTKFEVIAPPTTTVILKPGSLGNTLSWMGTKDLAYYIQYKNDLKDTNWITITKPIIGNDENLTWEPEEIPTQRFYRVRIGPE